MISGQPTRYASTVSYEYSQQQKEAKLYGDKHLNSWMRVWNLILKYI
jgi:hypothetical protein